MAMKMTESWTCTNEPYSIILPHTFPFPQFVTPEARNPFPLSCPFSEKLMFFYYDATWALVWTTPFELLFIDASA